MLAHFVFGAADDKAGRMGWHEKAGNSLFPGRLVGDCKDNGHLGIFAGRDELLDAVEHEEVAILVGACRDR